MKHTVGSKTRTEQIFNADYTWPTFSGAILCYWIRIWVSSEWATSICYQLQCVKFASHVCACSFRLFCSLLRYRLICDLQQLLSRRKNCTKYPPLFHRIRHLSRFFFSIAVHSSSSHANSNRRPKFIQPSSLCAATLPTMCAVTVVFVPRLYRLSYYWSHSMSWKTSRRQTFLLWLVLTPE